MPKLTKVAGITSEIWQIKIMDASSNVGAGLTALVFNSANLIATFQRDTDTAPTAITLVDMTLGTYTSGGFKKISDTLMNGCYQFCPPNAAIAAGAKSCLIQLQGATNMVECPIEVQLTAVNPDSATAFMTSVASVVGAVGSVTGAVGSVTGAVGSVTGAVGSVSALAANSVTASALATDAVTEIVNAVAALACTEPSAAVAASPTLIAAISWLLTLSRNKITQTATTQLIRNDADSGTIATSTVSDDGVTAIRGEFV